MLQSSCQNPETLEELDPTADVNPEQKGSLGHSVPDAKLPEKKEAWVNEADNTEVVQMTQDELDESAGEEPNNTASLFEDNSVMSSETASKDTQSSPSGPVASEEKLEDQSDKCEQKHSQKSEQRPPSDAKMSMASDVPRQKPTRRGGRGRKPKGPGPRQDENASRTPEKQDKSSASNATPGKNTPTRSHHQKGYDDFKSDVPNADRTSGQEKASAGNAVQGKNTPRRSHHQKGDGDFKGDVPNADRTPEKQEASGGNPTQVKNTPRRSQHQKGADRTPEKQKAGGNPAKSKNTPTRSRHPKSNDDSRGEAAKASPKNPTVERPEGSQGDAPGARGGAESTPRQLTRTVETSEKSSGEKGTPDANKQDHAKNARTGNPANSPGDSSKGGAPNRGRRRPRSRTTKGAPGDEKQDTRNRSNSRPEKRPPKNS